MAFDPSGAAAPELDDVAVVGMACRLPGAPDLAAYEALLRGGLSGRRVLTQDELASAGVAPDVFRRRNYVPVCYPIADDDRFDAGFFAYGAEAAATLDPQQRVFLEVAYHAIEHAGLRTWAKEAEVGVFAGCNLSTYLLFNLLPTLDPARASQALELLLANDKDYLAARLSYKLDLRGPSVGVQTACSSSLVAIAQACASLLNYECDAAVAGGAAVRTPHLAGYVHEAGGAMSPDGFCRSFDARAEGTVFGNGVGAVVLKRLADAIADRDIIHAVVKGAAVNNDGARKAGFSAPSIDGQARVIAAALRAAGVSADEIGFIEAHGTGTALGDPIEIAALGRVFGRGAGLGPRLIGSVKSNLGHCDSAAGVAGFIKAVIAVRDGQVAPSLNFEAPNPRLDLDRAGLAVAARAMPWPRSGRRLAGVSSFGMGGINAHLILAEPPPPQATATTSSPALVVCSAACESGLSALAAATAERLSSLEPADFANFAAATTDRRRALEYRLAVVAETPSEAADKLLAASARPGRAKGGRICLTFSGQGLFKSGDGADLFRDRADFRRGVEAVIDAVVDREARQGLIAGFGDGARLTHEGWWAPLGSLALQNGLFEHWMSRGLEVEAVIGHSVGEYAAAMVAGVMDLATAVEAVTLRSRLMHTLCPVGAMTAVQAPWSELVAELGASGLDVEIAAVNGPGAVTVSGAVEAIEAFEGLLRANGRRFERLAIDRACHSRLIEPMQAPFIEWLQRQRFAEPKLASYRAAADIEAPFGAPAYWAGQLRSAVRFDRAVEQALDAGLDCFLELGSGAALTVLGRMGYRGRGARWLSSLSPRAPDGRGLDETGAELWSAGIAPRVANEAAANVSLPSYPFQRRRFWRDAPAPRRSEAEAVERAALAAADRLPASLTPDRLQALAPVLTNFALGAMHRAVESLAGASWANDEAMMDRAGVIPQHRGLTRRWIERLDAAGAFGPGETRSFVQSIDAAAWDRLKREAVAALEDEEGYGRYLLSCAEQLRDVVVGRTPALETLFPKGRFDIVDTLYRDSAVARYFNGVAEAAVAALASESDRRDLAVFEIGAGTGGFTGAMARGLDGRVGEYRFTDISDFFFARARRTFPTLPLQCDVHDIDQTAANDSLAGRFDLVVASNVLHATPDLRRAVAHAVELLAPGGWLVINELVDNTPWLEITVGLIEGWRLHADGLRSDGPLITVDQWRAVLDEAGLREIVVAPEPGGQSASLGQHVIMARKPGASGWREASGVVQRDQGSAGETARARVYGRLRRTLLETSADARAERLEEELRRRLGPEARPGGAGERGFFDMGLDSLKLVELAASLSDDLDLEVPSAILFEFPTVPALTAEILRLLAPPADPERSDAPKADGVTETMDDEELLRRLEAKLVADRA